MEAKEQAMKPGPGRPRKVKPVASTQTEIPEPREPRTVETSTMTDKAKRAPRVKKEVKPEANKFVEAFKEVLEEHDISKKGKRDERARGKRLIKEEFEGHPQLPAPVHETDEYRHFILSMSLFPNLYNREMIMTHLGSS